jgi:hypothetical protein
MEMHPKSGPPHMKSSMKFASFPFDFRGKGARRMSNPVQQTGVMNAKQPEVMQLSLAHALRIKTAEYWLQLGQGKEALRELEKLPERVQGDSRVLKARVAAIAILRQRNEIHAPG